jgi:sugar phosphate isomerase/epimerase
LLRSARNDTQGKYVIARRNDEAISSLRNQKVKIRVIAGESAAISSRRSLFSPVRNIYVKKRRDVCMQFIISAVTWEKALTEDMMQSELPALAVKFGCKGVEFRPYWRDVRKEIPEVKRLLARHGLIATYACNDALLGDSVESTQQSLEAMAESVNIAYLLDVSILRVVVANGAFSPELIRNDWWRKAVDSVVSLAAEKGITIAVENLPAPDAGNVDLLLSLLETVNSPHFRLTFDTGNWLLAGHKPDEALDKLVEYVGYVHLKDMVPQHHTYAQSFLGTGAVEVMGLMNRILQAGYRGPFALEFPGGDDPEEKVRLSLKYLYGK